MHEAEKLTAGQRIYFFGDGGCEGDPDRKDLLGGKGASLAAMSRAGLPVPQGFTISIACCKAYHAAGGRWPEGLEDEVRAYMQRLEKSTGLKFGEGREPLLVSVRSGAAKSMPGMMDTILNCGLHPALAEKSRDPAHFWTVYGQFARQFAVTVAKIEGDELDTAADAVGDGDDAATKQRRAEAFMKVYEENSGRTFPRTAWDALRDCIDAVFDSWNNERAKIYRKAHGLESLEGTAVNVQSMFNSRVSGIAFTANPSRPTAEEIIIESSYGLGESIVSGDVTPDRFVLDRDTLHITERSLGNKDHVMSGLDRDDDEQPLDPSTASLTDAQIGELAKLALKVENYFGYPVDIEWGLARGKLTLLQSRAIRGLEVARDVEVGRVEEIERLRRQMAEEGKKAKAWIVHNLSETLEAPTPLTWDIMREFMSGDGGFGRMYKDLGYRPSERVRTDGFLELICGRIYCDPDRTSELFWEGMPMEYDRQEVLADPRVLETAPTKFAADKADEKFLLRLPGTLTAMLRSNRTMKRARATTRKVFDEVTLPPYLEYVASKRAMDLSTRPTSEVISELRGRMDRVLTDFGAESLKPGFFGGCARAELEGMLVQLMGELEGAKLCQVLTSGLNNDSTVEQNAMLFRVAQGTDSLDDFVDMYGHRAVAEMELSKPRWREDRSYLEQIIGNQNVSETHSPASLHKRNEHRRHETMEALPGVLAEWGGSSMREEVTDVAREAQDLLPYREIGKHYLLMGYEVIRSAILELGRRWGIGDDVFFLHLDELGHYEGRSDELNKAIAARKTRWQSARRLDLPDVIDSEELDQLGLPRQLKASKEMTGLSLSSGIVTGTARIVFSPSEAKDLGDDCVLVCPSTDPSWTALFTTIKGLVVERGGVLSHGAITARDFSIPAVACADTTQTIPNGVKIRVDGDRGQITIIDEE